MVFAAESVVLPLGWLLLLLNGCWVVAVVVGVGLGAA